MRRLMPPGRERAVRHGTEHRSDHRAAIATFGRDPDASLADVAEAAGVGRVTLYAHFPNRRALIEATLDHILTEGRAAWKPPRSTTVPRPKLSPRDRVGLGGPRPPHLAPCARQDDVSDQLRQRHEPFLARIEALIERGRRERTFRTDLPTSWLVTTYYTMVHGAGREVVEGRLDAADAPRLLTATLLAAYAPPDERRERSR